LKYNAGNDQRQVATKTFAALYVYLMLNKVETALLLSFYLNLAPENE
jgi:hypothetical protein